MSFGGIWPAFGPVSYRPVTPGIRAYRGKPGGKPVGPTPAWQGRGTLYYVTMAKAGSPCEVCGKPIERYVRPGRKVLCLEHALAFMAHQQLTLHQGTSPQVTDLAADGEERARQFRERSGPWYDRWREGMQRHARSLNITE